MSSWHSPASIYNLGHRAIGQLFDHPVYVEEKVDGSFFAFGLIADETGELRLRVRSKGAEMYTEAPEKMFSKAVEAVKERVHLLTPGWTYRGEYLQKAKHNSLSYDRTPNGHIILFDILTDDESFLPRAEMTREAERIGFEYVPLLASGMVTLDELRNILDNTVSVLGGQKIEGVVIKQLEPLLYGIDKKLLMGKFVSERFREIHVGEWKKNNPTPTDVCTQLASMVGGPARFEKALIHLKEAGKIEGTLRDIGGLIKEIPQDIEKECKDIIVEKLWEHFWPQIRRIIGGQVPQWYKDHLLREQFNDQETESEVKSEITKTGGGFLSTS